MLKANLNSKYILLFNICVLLGCHPTHKEINQAAEYDSIAGKLWNDPSRAIKYYDSAIMLNALPEYYIDRGDMKTDLDNDTGALKDIETAISLISESDTSNWINYNLVRAYCIARLRRHDEAIFLMDVLLNRGLDSSTYLAGLSYVYSSTTRDTVMLSWLLNESIKIRAHKMMIDLVRVNFAHAATELGDSLKGCKLINQIEKLIINDELKRYYKDCI